MYKNHGWKVKGVDGGDGPEDALMIDKSEFVRYDFRRKYTDTKKYTLAMSLECAEHIPEANADEFIDTLTSLSDVILFSGALPYQRGRGHVNEQYPSYWIKKFEDRGYQVLDVIRPRVWMDERVRGFYAQNAFIYVKKGTSDYDRLSYLVKENRYYMYDVVHPETWECVNHYKLVRFMDRMHENRLIAWIYYKFIKKNRFGN